mmetsp:Transcript_37328/g.111819  ORF Transcript_37328/g.111819 Transcript_37328/m.111819 type:complete len:91 (+) Transcript_37328:536-808(+)
MKTPPRSASVPEDGRGKTKNSRQSHAKLAQQALRTVVGGAQPQRVHPPQFNDNPLSSNDRKMFGRSSSGGLHRKSSVNHQFLNSKQEQET